jgi:hypothetical protein
LFRLAIICLTEASHKEHEQLVGNQVVKLHPGQFVTGRFDLHKMYHNGLPQQNHVSEITVWRWLQNLEKLEFLNINSNNKFSIVTVINWTFYQTYDQQNEQQMINKRSTNEQQMITNNNVLNNGNNGKQKKPSSRHKKTTYDENHPYYQMALYLYDKIMNHAVVNKKDHLVRNSDMNLWADDFRKMIELDNRERLELKAVIDWCTSDDFWQTNILSAAKLRKHYVKLAMSMGKKRKSALGKSEKNMDLLRERMEDALHEQRGGNEPFGIDLFSLPDGRTD